MQEVVEIKFAKVHPNAIIPSKREEDAALDIYACFDKEDIVIEPHTNKLIPTGIASAFSSDWVVVLRERGSSGVKNMKINAGVIDSGYRGEYFVSLYNGNDIPIVITKDTNIDYDGVILYPYEKAIAQALVLPVPPVSIEEITYEELKAIKSERGIGALGSSNK